MASKSSGGAGSAGFSAGGGYGTDMLPPTPKNTPFYMTPPLTPPNEALINPPACPSPKPDDAAAGGKAASSSGKDTPSQVAVKSALVMQNVNHLFQPVPAQALVVERMSSGTPLPPGLV